MEQETQVALISDRNALDNALFRWELVAHTAAAIHFHKFHLKKKVMDRFRDQLSTFRDINKADAFTRHRVLGMFRLYLLFIFQSARVRIFTNLKSRSIRAHI